MLIPSLFEQKLVRDPTLHAAVHLTLTTFEPWLRTSGMPFFPGFTDHSDLHLSEVLATAAALINDDSRDLISPSDIAVLVLAVLLHDIGMHLTEDSFRYLIASNTEHPRITAFDILSWKSLWADFLSEASRFDGRRLTLIFGDSKPLDLSHFDVNNLGERDRLLVGDFVRRHHCRLAHEIALWGVPFDAPQRKQLREVPAAFADLAGLVARSHGLELRDTLGYLQENYALREYQGVHAVFLMGILRIADYIQIHDERANRHLLSVRRLRSPLSKLEWDVHHAIRDIRNTHEDPEALFVDALPQDARVYEKLSELFRSIQHELDSTWAALGEVYGRYPPLNRLGLTIRRIRSSLDPPSTLPGRLSFLPLPARFDTAGTDLLKLLVGPLYGDMPEIAIRELIQNAVDACSERADWEAHRDGAAAQTIYGVEVLVEEEQSGARWVTVADRGIGMTEDVIRNYFLRAGASFRTSDAWRKRHEDDDGRPRIYRGGRFGIGALAAFLVADEIHVTTRHASAAEDRAIAFVANLDSDAIELRYTAAPVGTTIRLPIASESVWNRLAPSEWELKYNVVGIESWNEVDWFCLDTPPVSVATRTKAVSGTKQPRQNKLTYLSGCALRWLCKMPPPLTKLNRSTARLRP